MTHALSFGERRNLRLTGVGFQNALGSRNAVVANAAVELRVFSKILAKDAHSTGGAFRELHHALQPSLVIGQADGRHGEELLHLLRIAERTTEDQPPRPSAYDSEIFQFCCDYFHKSSRKARVLCYPLYEDRLSCGRKL